MITINNKIVYNHNCIWQIRRQYGVYFCDMILVKYSSEIIDKTRSCHKKITDFVYKETDTLAFVYTNPDISILSFDEYKKRYFPNFFTN